MVQIKQIGKGQSGATLLPLEVTSYLQVMLECMIASNFTSHNANILLSHCYVFLSRILILVQ